MRVGSSWRSRTGWPLEAPCHRTRHAYDPAIRILFTFLPGSLGHFLPLVPLAEAAESMGHEVAFVSGANRGPAVVERGFRFFPAGLTYSDMGAELRRRYPDWPWGPDFEHVYSLGFAGVYGPAMAEDLPRVLGEFPADVLVAEVGEFGGPVIAAAASIPWAALGWALPIPVDIAEAAGQAAAPMWAERGLDEPPYGGLYRHCYLDPCPPSLDPGDGPRIARRQPLRPALPGGGSVPEWLAHLPDRPTVYVTLGTAASFAANGQALLDAVAEGLGGLDMNVVISGTAAEQGGPVPPNVYMANFVPLSEVLPRSQLVISHAGAGTILAALRAAVPHLVLPMGADQFRNADALVRAGVARRLDLEELTGGRLRDRVEEMIGEPGGALAARGIAAEIHTMPGPDRAISTLEALTGQVSRREYE